MYAYANVLNFKHRDLKIFLLKLGSERSKDINNMQTAFPQSGMHRGTVIHPPVRKRAKEHWTQHEHRNRSLYYKMRQAFFQNGTAILLQNATKVYYKMRQVFYYKMRKLLQKASISLQNETVTTKCDVYYKISRYIC